MNYESSSDSLSTKSKKKKYFGRKIRLVEWDHKDDQKVQEEEDMIDYIQSANKIDFDTVRRFTREPEEKCLKFLQCILKGNPTLNIRKRDKDYLLRIKIKRKKITKKFTSLKEAQELRNILLLYSMANDTKFQMHLLKRNRISEANKKKKNENDDFEEENEADNDDYNEEEEEDEDEDDIDDRDDDLDD